MPGLKRKSEPGSSSKLAKKPKRSPSPTKPFLSTEYVVDSSDDETVLQSAKANRSASKVGGRPIPSIAATASTVLKARPKNGGQESPSPNKRKYQSPIRSSTASESSDMEGSDVSEGSEARSIVEVDQRTPRIRDTTVEESEDATDSEGSDETRSETEESVEGRKPIDGSSIATSQKPPPPYKPPAGFKTVSIMSPTMVRTLFSKENSRGKQIWHITAPKFVPVTSIKEVPIDSVATGESVLSYGDADYGLLQEAGIDREEKALLVPSPGDDGYRLASVTISKTLHLREIVKFSALSDKTGGVINGAFRTSKSHVKEVRQQPQGLRMRYRPFGDDSSSDDSDRAPRFKMPPIIFPNKSSTEPRPMEGGSHVSPAMDGMEEAQDTPRPSTKSTSRKRKAVDPDEPAANETLSGERPLGETATKEAQRRARKKQRKERRTSGSKNPWEAEEARKILAASEKPEKSTTATNAKSDDMALEGKRPEVVKTKRKKRKSEVTEEA
ncbi:MAG: hypothetical protein Q9211_006485 [Gyalolechia sp. 1 TL-2023]